MFCDVFLTVRLEQTNVSQSFLVFFFLNIVASLLDILAVCIFSNTCCLLESLTVDADRLVDGFS